MDDILIFAIELDVTLEAKNYSSRKYDINTLGDANMIPRINLGHLEK